MHPRWRPIRLAVVPSVALLVVLWCAPGVAAAQAPAGEGKGFIWHVEREGRTSWLVGSLHVLTPDYYPLPAAVEDAFEHADTLMQEADVTEMGSPELVALLASKAFYTGAESLETRLSADTYALVQDRFARAGLPVEPVRLMRPWMAALTLFTLELQRAGFDPAYGIDWHFRQQVERTGKTFRTLETPAEQIEYLAALDDDAPESFLRAYLATADDQIRQVEELATAWHLGDTAILERVLLASLQESPRMYQSLLVDRNHRWLPAVDACLQEGGCFVVVGAGHMVGADGLVALLRQRGYTVEQR